MTSTEIANASKIMLGSTEATAMYIGSIQMWSTNQAVGECIRNFNYQTGTYINQNNGSVVQYDNWSSSDYIDVSKYIRVYCNSSDQKYGAYYDENKNYISSFQISKPNNAKYVRYSTTTSEMSNGEIIGIIQ